MPNVLREHGFVFIIAILLIAFVSYFIYDSNKYNVSQQSDNGQDVVMSIDKGAVTADALYERMLDNNGVLIYNIYRNEVINQTIKTTDKLKKEATSLKANIEAAAQQQGGENYESVLESELATYGFSGLDQLSDYCLVSVKEKKMNNDYVTKHFDEYKESLAEKHPRSISVITVNVMDPDNLSEQEQKKKDDIDASIESQGFAKTATAFSDDYTASQKGVAGYIDDDSVSDTTSGIPTDVATAALNLEEGQTSDWITVVDDRVGSTILYKVHVDSTDVTAMYQSKNSTIKDQLLYAILNNNKGLATTILQEQAKKIDIKFEDESFKQKLDDAIAAQTQSTEEQEETEE